MFFEFESGKDGIIKSVSFNISKLNDSTREHLEETLKNKVKYDGSKCIVKCHMTFEELNKINKAYNEFHSQFILENVIPGDLMKKEIKKEAIIIEDARPSKSRNSGIAELTKDR